MHWLLTRIRAAIQRSVYGCFLSIKTNLGICKLLFNFLRCLQFFYMEEGDEDSVYELKLQPVTVFCFYKLVNFIFTNLFDNQGPEKSYIQGVSESLNSWPYENLRQGLFKILCPRSQVCQKISYHLDLCLNFVLVLCKIQCPRSVLNPKSQVCINLRSQVCLNKGLRTV